MPVATSATLQNVNDSLPIVLQVNSAYGPDGTGRFTVSGTHTGASVVVEKCYTAAEYAAGTWTTLVGAIRMDSNTPLTAPVSLSSNSTLDIILPPVVGLYAVRLRLTAISTGSISADGSTYPGAPGPVVPITVPNATSIGVANALTSVAGVMASTEVTQLGSAGATSTLGTFREEGNIAVAAANPVGGNGADTTDDVLWGVQIPANVFDQAYRQITLAFQGQTGATTNNKRFKVFVNPTLSGTTLANGVYANAGTASGGTVILDSGAWVNGTTPNSNVAFAGGVQITKYGAANSNTQMTGQAWAILGATHGGAQAGQALTLAENAAINIVITGSSYTTGAANDIKLQTATLTGSN